MKAIILAAGYGTRLYPLTKNVPKALLDVSGRPIIEYLLENIERVSEVDEIVVTSNKKFVLQFREWMKEVHCSKNLRLYVNNSKNDHDPVSVLYDLHEIIRKEGVDDDLLLIAGDNLFDFSLRDFVRFARKKRGVSFVGHRVKSKELAKKFGVLRLKGDLLVDFEEKPAQPKSTLVSTAVYYLPRDHVAFLYCVGEASPPTDNIGHFIHAIYKKEKVFVYQATGNFFDIGTPDDYAKVKHDWRK